jgi:hypothetical protein
MCVKSVRKNLVPRKSNKSERAWIHSVKRQVSKIKITIAGLILQVKATLTDRRNILKMTNFWVQSGMQTSKLDPQ